MTSDKLIVALDVSNMADAEKLVKSLSPTVKIFKIGKELFTAEGPRVVKMVHSHLGKVFLDLKYHDIPNTAARACEAATRLGVFMMNVHVSGGKKMMSEAAQAVKKTSETLKIKKPLLIGVTVLTSMDRSDLKQIGVTQDLGDQVETLARLAQESGLDGVVASPLEIAVIRKAAGPEFTIVTPGVRPVWAAQGDQKRVMTPKEAVDLGSNFIVVGRPITAAQDPKEAAHKIISEIS